MKRIVLLFSLVLILTLILSACNLPASKAPAQVSTQSRPTPVATNQTLHEIVSSTQTAIAKAGGSVATREIPTLQSTLAVANTSTPTPAGVIATSQPTTNIPTQAPAITVPTPTPGLPATYMIHEGEWCYCIARRFNILAGSLLAVNPPCQNNSVVPGTVLTIPQGAPTWDGERSLVSHPTTFAVRPNDTIFTIACYFGAVDPNAIIYANSLASPYTLVPGQILNIP